MSRNQRQPHMANPDELYRVVEQVQHGPYLAAPPALVQRYIEDRFVRKVSLFTSDEQIAEDVEGEWQYDQHSAAYEAAMEAGQITGLDVMIALEVTLRPWWVGHRNAHEQPQ